MSDLLGQALLLQARQPRRESAQSRLAAQMLAGMNAPPNMGGPLDVLNRASAGIFGTLMAQRAEADARAHEKQDMGAIFDYQNEQQRRLQQYYSGNLGAPDGAPAAGGMGAMTPAVPPPPQAEAPAPGAPAPARVPSPAMRALTDETAALRAAVLARTDLTPQEVEAELRRIANNAQSRAGAAADRDGIRPDAAGPGTIRPNAAPTAQPLIAPAQQPQRTQPAALDDGMTPDMRAALTRIEAGMRSGDPTIMAAAQRDMQMLRAQQTMNLQLQAARRAEEAANRETFSAPTAVQIGGRPVMVQVGNRGTIREVPNMQPATPPDETERLLSAAGLVPGTPEFQAAARAIVDRRGAPPTTNVNVDNRSESALLRADTDTLKDINTGATQARGLLSLFDRAETAIRNTPEGAGAQFAPIVGQLARSLGFNIEGTSEAEVLRSIQNQMASLQRLPGSGATSDRDMALFLQAVPRLGNTRDGNLALVDMGRRLMQRRIEEAGVFRRHIGQPDLQERLDALPPIFSEREREMLAGTPQAPAGAAQGLMQQMAPTGPSVQGPAPGMTASPPLPRPTSAEEMRRLPPGTRFIAPDGSLREVPR